MYTVYILKSEQTGKFYVGYTDNIDRRIKQHNSGKNKSTHNGLPWTIIHKEFFNTKKEAWLREHQIKSYKGGVAFKKLVK